MYHTCNSFPGHCLIEAVWHRHLDFFFAQLLIPVITLHLVQFSAWWAFLERILLLTAAFVIFMVQLAVGESIYIQMVISAVCLAGLVAYWIVYAVWNAYKNPEEGLKLPDYHWENLGWGIGLLAIACSLFGAQMQYHLIYWAVHSCWHVNAGMGLLFVMLSKDKPEGAEYKSLDVELVGDGAAQRRHHPLPQRVSQLRLGVYQHETPKSRVREMVEANRRAVRGALNK